MPTNNFCREEKSGDLLFHYRYNDMINKIQGENLRPYIAVDFGTPAKKLEDQDPDRYFGRMHNVHVYGDHLFFSFDRLTGMGELMDVYHFYTRLSAPDPVVYRLDIQHPAQTPISLFPEVLAVSGGKFIFQIVPGELPDGAFDSLRDTAYGTRTAAANPLLVLYDLD